MNWLEKLEIQLDSIDWNDLEDETIKMILDMGEKDELL